MTTRWTRADELRFTLTSEAGLNDGLAFPFVYAAILLATEGAVSHWGLEWVGVLPRRQGRDRRRWPARWSGGCWRTSPSARPAGPCAWPSAASRCWRSPRWSSSYGVGEVLGGYGFLSVFVCALTFRSAERAHDYHAAMHEVAERLERLLTLFVLLVLGIALTRGLLDSARLARRRDRARADLPGATGRRPASPWRSAAGRGDGDGLTGRQRWAAAFFGVRGVGSIYYLAYAAGEADELGQDWLWSTVAFTIVASVLVHGVLSTPVMARLERGPAPEPLRGGSTGTGRRPMSTRCTPPWRGFARPGTTVRIAITADQHQQHDLHRLEAERQRAGRARSRPPRWSGWSGRSHAIAEP